MSVPNFSTSGHFRAVSLDSAASETPAVRGPRPQPFLVSDKCWRVQQCARAARGPFLLSHQQPLMNNSDLPELIATSMVPLMLIFQVSRVRWQLWTVDDFEILKAPNFNKVQQRSTTFNKRVANSSTATT